MKLSSLLNQDLFAVRAQVSTVREAIELLLQKMYRQYNFEFTKEEVSRALADREALGGTIFNTGLAIPHARLEKLNDLLVGVCIPERPIEVDGMTIRIVVLLLTDISSSSLYLHTLAAFAALSKDPARFGELMAAQSPGELFDTIKKYDIQVKKELTVSDIMTRGMFTVTPETNLKDFFNLCASHNLSYVPVVDAEGDFIGEVTVSDALKLGIPEYAAMIGSLNFLTSFEPFENLLRDEQTLLVSQVMRKPSFKLTENTSILEAALELTQNKRRHIPVVQGTRILGIVSTMDILTKVLRG